ncbi:MAG: aminodeoxychorismate synthase component I [Bacteroidales bacterium]|jgi:para-aminobenzoate synthetase component 1|nr:aminodeoxychorismate synthase component I [Bacteroidales bacterium]NPV36101.1 aminodeoxychorismate synthase component I [Bacteroidales bacterium]
MSDLAFVSENELRNHMNNLGAQGIPFLFIISFLKDKNICLPLGEINPGIIGYDIAGNSNTPKTNYNFHFNFEAMPVSYEDYLTRFEKVMQHIRFGNTYLINLTLPTPIRTSLNLHEIFQRSKAPYKLWLKNNFTVFSPEIFIRVKDGRIYSYPMKGTLDASIANADKILLESPKERAEHFTIVDLIRNDLSMVSTGVNVKRFMYLDRIKTHKGELLQASSEIEGILPTDWKQNLGEWFLQLLPAGSISGAPKRKTVEILLNVEGYNRGFYTGVFGIFDGEGIESAVMIRFIEETPQGLVFKSGGGITFRSDPWQEYQELIQKVYVPIA